jgi:cytidine deaminase
MDSNDLSRQRLLRAAERAADFAHAPYSHFKVGAAVLDEFGTLYTGCNIESGSYTATLHAEAVALAACIGSGAGRPVAVAVACIDHEGRSSNSWPCGICRQLLVELMGPGGVVHTNEGSRTVGELLPEAFTLTN